MVQHPLAVGAIVVGITLLGLWLSRRFTWAAKVGGSLLVILLGALLSNLDLVPAASPIYDYVYGPVTSLAIVWLLLAVNLADLKRAGPRMLAIFGIALVATSLGALTAAFLFAGSLPEGGWKLAGVMTGTYSGGSLNFVAVGRALDLPEALFTAATASDNVLTALWIGATLLLPAWLGRFFAREGGPEPGEGGAVEDPLTEGPPPGPLDLLLLLAIGGLLSWAAEAVGRLVPQVPSVLWLTSFALVAAQVPAVRRLKGTLRCGYLALHLFFAVIGIGSRISEIAKVGIEVFYFTAVVVLVHGLLTYAGAWLARSDAETASVASQAAVGGPSTALALALARGRPDLALPGLSVGLLGYAVGNYAGLGVAHLVRVTLGP